jgi:hypothetical protein
MAQQNLNLGTTANDGTGDALRVAGQKIEDNFTDLYTNKLDASAVGTAAAKNTGTSSGNVPVLDSNGLLNTAVLPALAISDVFTVADQTAMLALTAQKGDIAIRSDLNKTFALSTNSPSTLADWKELKTPTDAVSSVAGQTGAITSSALKTAIGIGNFTMSGSYSFTGTLTGNTTVTFPTSGTLISTTSLDTDPTMAANSDTVVPSQKAVKAAITAGTAGVSSFNNQTGSIVYLSGMHNRLINPNGQIWQRQNSGAAAITDGTYAFDRWYGLTQSAGITASLVTNAEDGTPFMMRLTQANSTAQRFGIGQVIESANSIDLRGQDVMLSARVRMSSATTLRFAVISWAGTADAVTKDFVSDWTNGTFTAGNFFTSTNTNVEATGSVALSANTLTTISLAATISSSANNVAVIFWTDSTQAQNVTLDIGKVQLEIGSGATPLAQVSFGEMLLQCQRYYEKSYVLTVAPGAVSTGDAQRYWSGSTQVEWFTPFKTMKIKTPSVTVYSGNTGASGNIRDVSSGADVAASGASPGVQGFNVQKSTGGTAAFRYDAHWAANAEL